MGFVILIRLHLMSLYYDVSHVILQYLVGCSIYICSQRKGNVLQSDTFNAVFSDL